MKEEMTCDEKFLLSLLFLCAMAAAGFPRIGALAATTDDLPQGRRGTLGEGQSTDNNYGTVYNNNLLTNNYGLVSNIRRVDETFLFSACTTDYSCLQVNIGDLQINQLRHADPRRI